VNLAHQHPILRAMTDQAVLYVANAQADASRAQTFRVACEVIIKVFIGAFIIGYALLSAMPID